MPVGSEEHLLGVSPSRDGSDYNPYTISPTWAQLVNLLTTENITRAEVMFVGKTTSSGQIGGTGFGIVTRNDVLRVPLAGLSGPGSIQAGLAGTLNPGNTAQYAKELLKLNVTPLHVTGIIIRRLS